MEDGECKEKFDVKGLESRKKRWLYMGDVVRRVLVGR